MADFGEKLKLKRKAKGLSQLEVAEAVGVTQKAYSLWEDGKRNPKMKSILLLEKVLGSELLSTKESAVISQGSVVKETAIKSESDPEVDIVVRLQKKLTETYEDRLRELKEDKAFLQRMIETSLGKLDRIERLSESTLADLKGSMKYQAEREAKGNIEKQNDIESHVSKLAGDALVVILSSNKSEVPYK